MANNVYNPAIPYLGPIPGPLAPGFSLLIRGSSHPSCDRFAVNLQCGANINPRDDVLLHIGVDFLRNCVVRNSIHNMSWGPEESQPCHFPFNRGAPFEIAIRCESTHFNITINGQQFATFEHRIVYHRASHITIDGGVLISSIEYNGNQCNPHGTGLYPSMPHAPGFNTSSVPYPVSPSMPTTQYPYPTSGYGPQPQMGHTMHGVPQPPRSPNFSSSHAGGVGGQKHGVVDGLLKKIGVGGVASTGALAATAGLGYLGSKKAWKAQKKARKKALKFGIPLAGAGLGAYAISKAFHSGSSSSSSSSSDEE